MKRRLVAAALCLGVSACHLALPFDRSTRESGDAGQHGSDLALDGRSIDGTRRDLRAQDGGPRPWACVEEFSWSATSVNVVHSVAAGTRLLLVEVAIFNGADVAKLTLDGQELSPIGQGFQTGRPRVKVFARTSPLVGARTLVVTFTSPADHAIGICSWSGFSQATVEKCASSEGFMLLYGMNKAPAEAAVLVAAVKGTPTISTNYGQTVTWLRSTSMGSAGSSHVLTNTTAATLFWSVSASTQWAYCGLRLKP